MQIQLNVFQEVFLVSFSILYGIMLQTFFGVNAFPWGRIRKNTEETTGLKNDKIVLIRRKLVFSIILLNIIPFIYAVVILYILSAFSYKFWNYECYILIFQTFIAGLAVFGFQRWYGALAIFRKEYFPKIYDNLKKQLKNDIIEQKDFTGTGNRRPENYGYLYSTIFYIIAPFFSIFWSAYFQEPLVGFTMWIIFMIVFLSFLFSKKITL